MKVLICKWGYPVKGSNKRYKMTHRPVIIEDHPEDQGRMIAEFGRLEDALEYIQFKGFEIVYSEWNEKETTE